MAPKVQRFEGHAYYQPAAVGRATWFDSSGMVRPIRAVVDGDAMVGHVGHAGDGARRDDVSRGSGRRARGVDRVLGKNGEWREFGRSTLRRRP